MASNVVFEVSTALEMDGRQLKAVKPNKDGIYTGIPLTVIGMNSRNNCDYERESVLKCLTDTNSRFAANVSTGDQEGEWGHPFLADDKSLARLLHIDRTKVSHCFTKVYGVQEGPLLMIYGDVKPFGPYKQCLIDSFEDPNRNTSFSLRSAAAKISVDNKGITHKKMLALVTFDAVDGPGFLRASKRYRDPSCENFELEVNKSEFLEAQKSLEMAGEETIVTTQRILDAFCCDKLTIKERCVAKNQLGRFVDESGNCVSLFDQCFGS